MGNIRYFGLILIGMMFTSSMLVSISAEQSKIPNWIRNDANWWYQGQIQDSDFIKGMQFLLDNKIMIVKSSATPSQGNNTIPYWVKNNAGWWANRTISDHDFISGIQYLVDKGVIIIKSNINNTQNTSQCDKFTTEAEKETCIEQLQYDSKIENSMKTSVSHIIGPITFYYVNSESQKADDGKTILTIHFVVKNNSDQEVAMTCQRQDYCNYVLSDGQNKISYSTNTLVYGSLTLSPNIPKFVDWTFYDNIDSSKNYTFLVNEPWGSGSIPIKIS